MWRVFLRFSKEPDKVIGLESPDLLTLEPTPEPASNRMSAIVEVVLCSGIPTQLALATVFGLAGFTPYRNGQLSLGYVTTLLLCDAALLIGFIFWLLRRRGEDPRATFLGNRPVDREAWLGLPMTVVVFALAVGAMYTVRLLVPALRNVEENPMQQLINTPAQAMLLAVVATIGGGLREEIQRAFILHRFEQSLGGARLGLVLYSIVFGLEHSLQGWDAAVTTTLLGFFWGVVYLNRRSIVAPIVSHSGFNGAEIFVFLASK